MRSAIALSIAALAGSALAVPYYDASVQEVKNVHVVVETVVHTVYITQTDGYKAAKPTPTPESTYVAPVVTTIYEEPAPAPTTSVVYDAAPAPTPTPASAPADTGYQGIIDTWRAKLGLKALKNSSQLQSNAMDTVVSSNGQMIHKLNPGTYGQVLAPGSEDDFEHVFVGGWLCEIPTLPGLDGVCSTQSDGWTYDGQTGHAKILTDESYSEIGCALYAGIWCCDVA